MQNCKKAKLAFLLICFLLTGPLFAGASKKQKRPPTWMTEQIAHDFAPFKAHTITHKMVDDIMKDEARALSLRLIRCTLKNGVPSFEYPREENEADIWKTRREYMEKAFTFLATKRELPDLDFVFSLHDELVDHPNPAVPIFCFCQNTAASAGRILIPDFEALMLTPPLIKQVNRGIEKTPWGKKRDQLFWRGATTGTFFTADNIEKCHRVQLVKMSIEHPKLINARLTTLVQGAEKFPEEFQPYMGKFASVPKHLKYKYQLLIDGNSAAFSRAYWQLFSNSVIFKQASPYIQWFYGALKPNIHYISVKRDLSNLIDKLSWAKRNENLCKKISEQAQEFAKQNLTQEAIFEYLYLVLLEYATKQAQS